jgi:hypothetical protein
MSSQSLWRRPHHTHLTPAIAKLITLQNYIGLIRTSSDVTQAKHLGFRVPHLKVSRRQFPSVFCPILI